MTHQRAVAGPTEYRIQGAGGLPHWADGIEATIIVDAKHVGELAKSPQLGTATKWFNRKYRVRMIEEFGRIKSAIADPTNPLTSVEVRVNTEASIPYWEAFLKEQGIPGRVVVGGKPAPGPAARPSFVRGNAGAFKASLAFSVVDGFAAGVIRQAEQLAMSDVTNENSDPWVALHQLQFLRTRFNDPRGVWYALSTAVTVGIDQAQKDQRAGNEWLDMMEEYWISRQDAVIRANLPAIGSYPMRP
jgi:hypothetical protein